MATHSNILAWKISWPEEPGRLQSMGSKRVTLSLSIIIKSVVFTVIIFVNVLKNFYLFV